MKYTVEDYNGEEVSLSADGTYVHLVSFDEETSLSRLFTVEQFKDFRKAVGYIWQEVHSDGE